MTSRQDDGGVVAVVSAGLMLAAIVIFVAVFNATWVPVWVANVEATHADDLNDAVLGWADAAEESSARGVVGRAFSRVLPLGESGLPVLGSGASSGRVDVSSAPTLEIYDDAGATPDHTASGSLAATTDPVNFPSQTFRYALGALSVEQSEGTWVDLRNLLTVERRGGSQLDVSLQIMTLTGGPQSSGANTQASIDGELTGTDDSTGAATTYMRIRVNDVQADAWRAAVDRVLGEASLTKDADGVGCTTTAQDYCLDQATNTASTMDLYLRRIDAGWTVTEGTVDVDVRA